MSDPSVTRPPLEVLEATAVNLADTVVLKEDNAFLVTLPDGDVPLAGHHPLGLYLDDCRFLSGHELRLDGVRPRLLVASAATGSDAVHELTNPELRLSDGSVLPLQTLQVRLERSLGEPATLHERVHIHLYGRETLQIEFALTLAADFQPMLTIRGMAPAGPDVPVALEPVPGGVRFARRGQDEVLRTTTVTTEPRPSEVVDGSLRFALRLEPGEQRELLVTYRLHAAEPDASPPAATAPTRAARAPVEAWLAQRARVDSDDELFNRVIQRSLLDMRMLGSRLDGQSYYAAGIPWFATLFGRDSLITAIEMAAFDPGMAAETLRVLARRLGQGIDAVHDEEPGKVLHEMRVGEVATMGLTPLARYYGTVDATPLFLMALCEHADWAGDLALFRELRDAVEATLGWIDRFGDHDGDGFLDYRSSTTGGLRNQGWKDSIDGVLDEHGTPLDSPIALVEAQGYAVCAKRGLARLFAADGDPERARALGREADALAQRLDRFWLADRRCYSMALDGEGRASRALASNQGHLLWASAIDHDRAADVRDALMGADMFSGWGIRTLGERENGFNPVGYHLGTVWPHDTAIVAAGLRNYGHDEDFIVLFEALLEAASHAEGYRLPELFAGFSRAEFETPVPYPVACHPQAWAAGAIPYLLTTGLGLHADALEGRLRVRRPSLPRWVNRVQVENLRIGGARVDLLFERAEGGHVALTDAQIDGDIEVVLEISATRKPAR